MNKSVSVFAGLAIAGGVSLAGFASSPNTASSVMSLTPAEMKWEARGALALTGMEETNLVGDPAKPGPYTLRLKFPAGYKLAPHMHPDAREVTILSGTLYTAYADKFNTTVDPKAFKALPAGSFYTEPAYFVHIVETRGPTVIQVSGIGPSGRKFFDPANGQK